jgi:hypothetical protein
MSTASFMGKRIPVSGGGYFRLLPYWFIRAGLKQINEKQNAPFTFYLHPWEIDPEQPRVKASLKSRVRHYTNLDKCHGRLERLLEEFRLGAMRAVLANAALFAKMPGPAPS